jgi:hypothetical protein
VRTRRHRPQLREAWPTLATCRATRSTYDNVGPNDATGVVITEKVPAGQAGPEEAIAGLQPGSAGRPHEDEELLAKREVLQG